MLFQGNPCDITPLTLRGEVYQTRPIDLAQRARAQPFSAFGNKKAVHLRVQASSDGCQKLLFFGDGFHAPNLHAGAQNVYKNRCFRAERVMGFEPTNLSREMHHHNIHLE